MTFNNYRPICILKNEHNIYISDAIDVRTFTKNPAEKINAIMTRRAKLLDKAV